MTHHFHNTVRPKLVAKALQQQFDQVGLKKIRAECLETTAHVYGHASWKALVADIGRAEPSKDDHEVEPAVRAERRDVAIKALMASGASRPVAEKITDELAFTARAAIAEKLPADAILKPLAGLPCFRDRTGMRAKAVLAAAKGLVGEQVSLVELASMLLGSATALLEPDRNVDHLRMRSWDNVGKVWRKRMKRVVEGIPSFVQAKPGRADVAAAFGLEWNRLLDPDVDLKATVEGLVEAGRAGGTMADLIQVLDLFGSQRIARRGVTWAPALGSDLVHIGQINLVGSSRSHLGRLTANRVTQTALVNLFCLGDDIADHFMTGVASLIGRTTLVRVLDRGAEENESDVAILVSLTTDDGPIQGNEQFVDVNGVHDAASLPAYLGIRADQLELKRIEAGSLDDAYEDFEPAEFLEALAACLPWISEHPKFVRRIDEDAAADCLDRLVDCYGIVSGSYLMKDGVEDVAAEILAEASPKQAPRLN